MEKLIANEAVEAARRLIDEVAAPVGKDAEWVIAHANREYEETVKNGDYLDAKSDRMMAYAGAVGALFVGLVASKVTGWAAVACIPTGIAWLAALGFALSVQLARRHYHLPDFTDALADSEREADEATARLVFAARIHQAAVQRQTITDLKGRLHRGAVWSLLVAAAFMLLPLIVAAVLRGA